MASLPKQHTINLLLDDQYLIVDTNNQLNEVYPSFNRLNKELLPGFQLVDNFADHFSFNTVNCKNIEVNNAHICTLNKIFDDFLLNPNTILVISDASNKNNVVTLISHICSSQNILAKTIHCAINVTSTEVEMFSIRCEINQAI